jgi:ArsR family transcriptional regulator
MPELRSPFAGDFDRTDAAELAGVLKAFTDPARLRIISLLACHGPMAIIELVPLVGLSQPTVSHHVRILDAAGVIHSRRDRHLVYRTLDHEVLATLAGLLTPGGTR